MSVMTQTYDVRVSSEKHGQSAMSEMPVKYASDPKVGERVFCTAMPDLFVLHHAFAYFRVNGFLSHCAVDEGVTGVVVEESDLDLMHTRNTYDLDDWLYAYSDPSDMDAVGLLEKGRMEWIAAILSDFDLNGDMYRTIPHATYWTVHTLRHERYGTCYVRVLHQKSV